MHIEKNVCGNLFVTLVNVDVKSRDDENALLSFENRNMKPYFWLQRQGNSEVIMPLAPYCMSRDEPNSVGSVNTANSIDDITKLEQMKQLQDIEESMLITIEQEQRKQCQDLEESVQPAEYLPNESNKGQLVTDTELGNRKVGWLCNIKTARSHGEDTTKGTLH